MRQLLVATRSPFGITATARRDGIRLDIVTKGLGERLYANLSTEAAVALIADLELAVAEFERNGAPAPDASSPADQGAAGTEDGADAEVTEETAE